MGYCFVLTHKLRWRTPFYRLAYRLIWLYWRIFKPVTVGVRVLLIREGQVLLVRHVYQEGWFLPGGGVKRGERCDQAARREAYEEAGATLNELVLFGLYTSTGQGKTGHVATFLCEDFTIAPRRDPEIACAEFFPLDRLPGDVSPGCLHRIQAYQDGLRCGDSGEW